MRVCEVAGARSRALFVRAAQCAVIVCGALLLTPSWAQAQAQVTGVVRDTSGGVLPGVQVDVESPALIEKVRSSVTDVNGMYRVLDLRPGTYSVTFSLAGFSTSRREGIELSGDFVATVNGELKVGTLEESVTVTGVTPIVDIQNAVQQRVMQREVFEAIPSGRIFQTFGFLIPGMTATTTASIMGNQDVGGSRGTAEAKNMIHGSRPTDQLWYINGVMNTSGVTSSGGQSPGIPDVGTLAEVVVTYSAGLAELQTGGVNFNLVPREGGNRFSGSVFESFGNGAMQSSNLDDDLRSQGLTQSNDVKMINDFNPSVGGPIQRDKLWFFVSYRHQIQENYAAGSFYNANTPAPIYDYWGYPQNKQVTPATPQQLNTWTYTKDESQRGIDPGRNSSFNTRLTWQASQKDKISGFYEWQIRKNVPNVGPTQAPDASTMVVHQPSTVQLNWTRPFTNRLLFEAGGKFVRRPWCQCSGVDSALIPVLEQSTNLLYRGTTLDEVTLKRDFTEMVRVTYVTGTHELRAGFHNNAAWQVRDNQYPPISYRFQNGVPNQITLRTTPFSDELESDWEMGLFIQDRWTKGRATVAGGLRFDLQDRFYPAQSLYPTPIAPNRRADFPLTRETMWKDLTPRMQVALDVFGNGRTAVKANAGKFVNRAFNGYPNGNPARDGLSIQTTRSWIDSNRNFVVDCDLTNNLAQNLTATGGDNCGQAANLKFGQTVPELGIDTSLQTGWGKRQYNWEMSGSVQQQLTSRMSINAGYFRRIYGNFVVTKNTAVTAADFDRFSLQVPNDSRLPNSGEPIDDLVMISAAKFGQVSNLVTLAKNYGNQIEHYDGVDVSIDARPRAGVFLQGGMNTGRTLIDRCDLARNVPELGVTAITYCRTAQPLLTQWKMLGSYSIPRWDVSFSGTLQILPGPPLQANVPYPAADVAAALGRPVPGNPANVTVGVINPGTVYTDSIKQVDLRTGKAFRLRDATTLRFSLDVYNAFNANTVQAFNAAYGPAWLNPTSILTGRLMRVTAQLDF